MVVLYRNDQWDSNPTGESTWPPSAASISISPVSRLNPSELTVILPVTLAPVLHWSTIEVQITIVCACLPITRAMLVRLFPGVVGGESDQQSNPYPPGRASKAGFSRRPGDSHISKTVSYSVNYTSKPQRRDSDSMVHLVEVDRNNQS